MNDQPDLLAAGEALAEFANGVAADMIDASGDPDDGAHPNALASDWRYARALAAGRLEESFGYAAGQQAGRQHGTAERDDLRERLEELLDIALALRDGLGEALADESEHSESLEIQTRAMGAVARLDQLLREHEGKTALELQA